MQRATVRGMKAAALCACMALVAACGGDSGSAAVDDGGACVGAKCDTPDQGSEEACQARQAEVIGSSNAGFTRTAVRWACSDVEGVTAGSHADDDRGQEYCEYYAVINVPGAGVEVEALDFGRVLEGNPGGNVTTELALCIDADVEGSDASHCRAVITEDQLDELTLEPTEVVGACVFTAWHGDFAAEPPACEASPCGIDHAGVPVRIDKETMAMRGSFNTNGAAASLVRDCARVAGGTTGTTPDPENADDPLHEPFFRGCMATADAGGLNWRRSDPAICAAVMRTVECDCSAPGVDDLASALVPADIRGFRLGTWDDDTGLPAGCAYAELGDDSRVVVTCDLTAADLLGSLGDPKGACREIYGDNVVVHVDIPADALTCGETDPFGKACGEEPWVIGPAQ